jgi:alanine racemase
VHRANYNRNVATIEIAKRAATRPTWAEVSLRTLRENYRTIRDYVGPGVTVCAVVKAYAYGHGAVECAKALQDEGATWLGITSLDEAIPLREEGIDTRILLMTGFWRGEEEEVVRLGLTPTLWEVAHVELMEKAAIRVGVQQHHVHLKIDTGMGRLGATVEELAQVLQALRSASHLKLEGVATHLASSEVLDAPSVAVQLKNFEAARRLLREFGFNPTHVHAANTSAVISHHESWNTMVRPGLALYGYHLPFERAGRVVSGRGLKMPLKPVLTWKTRIFSLREMKAGQALGYGGTYVTKAPSRIAVLPVGYADGLNRGLSAGGRVIVRESYAPIVGRISMDLTLVDVTGISDIEVGDEVVLLGSSDGLNVDAREHAELANTIPYEILCAISKRVPRRYSS